MSSSKVKEMLKKLLRNRTGTAEIVGTVLFLVILLFFFSNVFLWHDQITQQMDQVIADKMNSAVRIETTVDGGGVYHSGHENILLGNDSGVPYDPSFTNSYDDNYRIIREQWAPPEDQRLEVVYTFNTTLRTSWHIAAVRLSVLASYEDGGDENCSIAIRDFNDMVWVNTGQTVIQEFKWLNMTLSQSSRYIDGNGLVQIRFEDSNKTADNVQGELSIDYLEVSTELVALEVTNLGGLDVTLSRLWIVNNTQTANPDKDHIYADLETRIHIWVAAGSRRKMVLSDETRFNSDGSINVTRSGDGIIVYYAPPAGQTVTFRVLTKRANTAACSYHFSHD